MIVPVSQLPTRDRSDGYYETSVDIFFENGTTGGKGVRLLSLKSPFSTLFTFTLRNFTEEIQVSGMERPRLTVFQINNGTLNSKGGHDPVWYPRLSLL